MHPQIIRVHDIHRAIEDVGINPYANTLVQEMGGEYFYVDAEVYPTYEDVVKHHVHVLGRVDGDQWWGYTVHPIPERLAWFIVDCLRLKGQAISLGSNAYDDSRTAIYLTPGKELFGHKVDKLTEIPAELLPVVVERL